MLVFLGGTCGQNLWRERFISMCRGVGVPSIALFNPVVKDWNEEAQQLEDAAKQNATVNLFYLGDPNEPENRVSFYSLCEAIMGLYDDPQKTVVVFDSDGMPKHLVKSMTKSCADLKKRFPEGKIFDSLHAAAGYLGTQFFAWEDS